MNHVNIARPQSGAAEARAFIAAGQPRTAEEIDYHVSVLEAGTPVAEAEMAVGISFQAIALAFVAALLVIPEAPGLLKAGLGFVALFSMVSGASFATRAIAGVYERREILRELYAFRRDFTPPARSWWKRLLS